MQYDPRYFEYRTRVAVQVARLAELLEQWERWDVDQLLPPRERTVAQPAVGGRDALSVLHRALLQELYDLEARAPTAAARP